MSSDLYLCQYCKKIFKSKEHEKFCSKNFYLLSLAKANLKNSNGNKDKDSGAFPIEQYSELKKLEQEPIYETKFLPINSQQSSNVSKKGGITFNGNQPGITNSGQEDNQNNINQNSSGKEINPQTKMVLGDLKELIDEIQNN
jgi:hypothetical protein